MVTNNCINGRLKFGEMKAGVYFAEGIREVLSLDTARNIAHLDLSNNLLGDKGAATVARAVRFCSSLVSLNMASNVIANAGMKVCFEELGNNHTLCELNISTIEGKNRNTITTTGI